MDQAKRPRIEISQFIENEEFRKYSEYLNDSDGVQDDADNEFYIVNVLKAFTRVVILK